MATVGVGTKSNLVPRGRDPFGQRRGSGPLARWDFESANRGLPVTLRRIKSKTQDGGEKWSRYISGRREIWIKKSWKSKYYPQTETRRDPKNNRFDAKRCFSRSPNWLRKIVNISNNATLDGLYDYMHSDQRPTQKKSIVLVVSPLNALIRDQVTK